MVAILHQVVRASYPPPGGGGGYSFTMTAGDYLGSAQGYSDGSLFPVFGSINAEPIPSNPLLALFTPTLKIISFDGDAETLLTGLSVWVDGVEYPFDGSDWEFGGSDTYATWDAGGPTFVDGVQYFVEIK